MRMFRCYNADCSDDPHGRPGHDFATAGDGKGLECPKCGGSELTPLVPVHLIVTDKEGPIKTPKGRRRVVCQPMLREIRGRLTGAADAVTCPVCKASKEFAAMGAVVAAMDEHEIPTGTPLAVAGKDVGNGP